MPNEYELALERLCVAAKGRDDLRPYIADALRAGATADQVAAELRRLLGPNAPMPLTADPSEGDVG